jgi:tRNA nucleotidyltransferase (CCA-adding enzyme)
MGDAFAEAVAAARERVDPDAEERAALQRAAETVLERAREAAADLPVEADVVQVGSTARGTWLSGDRDVDVFVRFPPDLDRDALEEHGLAVGHAVLPDGREEYAEHPYVTGTVDGFDVDLVPCYRVESAADIRSAVDRTPFHTAYLEDRLDDDAAAEVRLFKGFAVAAGVYGSDLRTRGLSGYLAELLVLEYGGFRATVEAVADWHPPVELDPADHAAATFDDPLVVVDPTDPGRNVAAVCAAESVARLQHHARALLADPAVEHFETDDPDPLAPAAVREHVARRGTTPVAVRTKVPALVDDQLYPQLRRSLSGTVDALDRRGFDVLRAAAWATDPTGRAAESPAAADGERTAVLFAELAVAERPAVERHEGPPVHVRDHADSFADAYAGAGERPPYGPFVDGDRYVVEREREHRTAAGFLRSDLLSVGLGTHVESSLAAGYDVLVGEAVAELADAFGAELARYFDPRP